MYTLGQPSTEPEPLCVRSQSTSVSERTEPRIFGVCYRLSGAQYTMVALNVFDTDV